MFKLVHSPTFTAKAHITIPGQDKPGEINVVWRHKTRAQLQDWIKRSANGNDEEILAEVIEGWSGVTDADGQVIAYSRESLVQLLETFPASGADLWRAYTRELTTARAKN